MGKPGPDIGKRGGLLGNMDQWEGRGLGLVGLGGCKCFFLAGVVL